MMKDPDIQLVVTVAVVGTRGSLGHWVTIKLSQDGTVQSFDSLVAYSGTTANTCLDVAKTIAEALSFVISRWTIPSQGPRLLQCRVSQQKAAIVCGVYAAYNAYSVATTGTPVPKDQAMFTRENIAACLGPAIGFAAVVRSAHFDMSAISAERAQKAAKEHVQHDETEMQSESEDSFYDNPASFYDNPAPSSFASDSSALEIDELPHNEDDLDEDDEPDEEATQQGITVNRGDTRLAFLLPAYVPPKSKYLHNFSTREGFSGTSEEKATVEFSRMRFPCLMTGEERKRWPICAYIMRGQESDHSEHTRLVAPL
jgi:hypothetical protein